jgi:tetratricopeptide (TPR) repeat protein
MKDDKKKFYKKEYTMPSRLFNFIHIVFAILIIGCAVLTVIVLNDVTKLEAEIHDIKTKIENTELDKNEISGTEAYFLEQYKELSNKTDSAIERILTIVGIAAGFTAVFGALLAFRAPNEINRNMDKLEEMINEAKENDKAAQEGIREAKYYAEIAGALSEQVNEQFTIRDKIDNINVIIKDYPDLSHAYSVRGDLFSRLSNVSDKKERAYAELAIKDYLKAMELGEDQSSCYNDIAIEYCDLGDNEKAIEYYSQAIEVDNNYAAAYTNRAIAYEFIGEYEKAFIDHNKAVSLDSNSYYAFERRATFYYDMLFKNIFFNEKDWQNNIELMIEDFKKAKKLDPSHPDIDKWLEAAYKLRDQYQSSPAEAAAQMAEPKTDTENDIENDSKNSTETIKPRP